MEAVDAVVQKSRRKTICISVESDLTVVIKCPYCMTENQIRNFLERHHKWVERHVQLQKMRNMAETALSEKAVLRLKDAAGRIVADRVEFYSNLMNVTPTGLKVTSARTRWGSCSWKNGLCFSFRIAVLPEELIDCIVVHELAHIRVKNHSAEFYNEVEKYMPDYRQRAKSLKSVQMQYNAE